MSAQVTACRFDLDRCIEAAAQIDAIRGRLFFGDDIEGEIPFVGDEGVIQARNARNPCLLVRSQSGDFSGRVVGGHVELGTQFRVDLAKDICNSQSKLVTRDTRLRYSCLAPDNQAADPSPKLSCCTIL